MKEILDTLESEGWGRLLTQHVIDINHAVGRYSDTLSEKDSDFICSQVRTTLERNWSKERSQTYCKDWCY